MSKITWSEFENVSRIFSKLQMIAECETGGLKDVPLLNVNAAGVPEIVLGDKYTEISNKLSKMVKKNDESIRLLLTAEKDKLIAEGDKIVEGFGDKVKELLAPPTEQTAS